MKKKSILIYGLARSGLASLKLLYNNKDKFFLFDDNAQKQKEVYESTINFYNVFILKDLDKSIIKFMDFIVISPSISIYKDEIVYAKKKKIPVLSELELGFLNTKNKIVAITGTNGKTTTVSLTYQIFKNAGFLVEKVGNIGCPLCERVKEAKRKTVFVCEVSSFQLEAIKKFCPFCAGILNITPDHIDRHKSMQNYTRTKFKIFKNFKNKNKLVLNENIKPKSTNFDAYTFGFKPQKKGCFVLDNNFVFCNGKKNQIVCSIKKTKMIGKHNLENIMASICFAKFFKIKNKVIEKTLIDFIPQNHRIQKVYETQNNVFFDDSKATNIDSTICAVKSFEEQMFLILGGSDKGYEYDQIFENLPSNVIKVVACGQVKDKIAKACQRKGFKNFVIYETLKEAVNFSLQNLSKGQILLLSPASASFDEFKDYKDRGEKFLSYIKDFYEGKKF